MIRILRGLKNLFEFALMACQQGDGSEEINRN